jgi:hypothetical protein
MRTALPTALMRHGWLLNSADVVTASRGLLEHLKLMRTRLVHDVT